MQEVGLRSNEMHCHAEVLSMNKLLRGQGGIPIFSNGRRRLSPRATGKRQSDVWAAVRLRTASPDPGIQRSAD